MREQGIIYYSSLPLTIKDTPPQNKLHDWTQQPLNCEQT